MGGMIAQTMAIDHPERVRSMVSIMSTTGNRWVGLPSLKTYGVLLGNPPHEPRGDHRRGVKTFKVIGSPGFPFEEERIREIAGRSYDRGHTAAGVIRQLHAIIASGDRTKALRSVHVPTTVIHGSRDLLVKPSGGRATARAIPGARLRMIDGMGHDLPSRYTRRWSRRSPPTPPARPRATGPSSRPEHPPPPGRPMRLKGVEPSRALAHTDLNRARLPVPPQPREQPIYRSGAHSRRLPQEAARRPHR